MLPAITKIFGNGCGNQGAADPNEGRLVRRGEHDDRSGLASGRQVTLQNSLTSPPRSPINAMTRTSAWV